jgi:hypothetical protein
MSEPIQNVQTAVTDTMDQFSSPAQVDTTDSSFLNSNGIIAKVVFLIMVIIVFVLLFYIVVSMISYFTAPSANPLLINGRMNGNNGQTIIPQNPANKASKLVQRSNNQDSGIEFTWAVWLKYTGASVTSGASGTPSQPTYSPVFVKGDCSISESINSMKFCSVNNGPGVYFYVSDTIHLSILMDTVANPASNTIPTASPQIIDIPNIPHNQYFHLGIRCQGSNIDTYINGTIIKRQNLGNVPKQNFYDIYVCPQTGFPGYLSNLQYFSRELSVVELNTIYQGGPNTKDANMNGSNDSSVTALSTSWFNSFLK